MAGFMKNAMSYLGMADVVDEDELEREQEDSTESSFDSDHTVTPDCSCRQLFGVT
jgi:cell division inhibitor SepF